MLATIGFRFIAIGHAKAFSHDVTLCLFIRRVEEVQHTQRYCGPTPILAPLLFQVKAHYADRFHQHFRLRLRPALQVDNVLAFMQTVVRQVPLIAAEIFDYAGPIPATILHCSPAA